MLELVNVSKRYGSLLALDELSFAVQPGQMYGFVGTNGAGKTTAMRIVMGVLEADSGVVRWRGRELDADVRRGFGYMPEERGLYPKMRVLDQLVYLARLRGVEPARAAEAAESILSTLALVGSLKDRVEELSLGNQQRVQLAAALVHDPELLVLDEPFSGLDPVGVDAMAGVLRERVDNGAAVVFSSHQLDLVERLCDAVGIIRAGRIIADGTVADLRGDSGRQHYRVEVIAPDGWLDQVLAAVPGATAVHDGSRGDSALIELPPDGDDQALLAAAARTGRIRRFGPAEPTLADLFREAVADEPDTAEVSV